MSPDSNSQIKISDFQKKKSILTAGVPPVTPMPTGANPAIAQVISSQFIMLWRAGQVWYSCRSYFIVCYATERGQTGQCSDHILQKEGLFTSTLGGGQASMSFGLHITKTLQLRVPKHLQALSFHREYHTAPNPKVHTQSTLSVTLSLQEGERPSSFPQLMI